MCKNIAISCFVSLMSYFQCLNEICNIVYLSARVTIIGPVQPFNFFGSFIVRVVT